MNRWKSMPAICLIFVAAAVAPAAAADAGSSAGSNAGAGVGFRGWGPRFGASIDADQALVGAQFDLGEFVEHLRWQPSFELGFGDDKLSFFGNFMVAYYFPVNAAVTPYAGSQVTLWLFDQDGPDPDNNDFDDGFNAEAGLYAVGGIETQFKGGTRFLAELQVDIVGDVPDFRMLVGWTF